MTNVEKFTETVTRVITAAGFNRPTVTDRGGEIRVEVRYRLLPRWANLETASFDIATEELTCEDVGALEALAVREAGAFVNFLRDLEETT